MNEKDCQGCSFLGAHFWDDNCGIVHMRPDQIFVCPKNVTVEELIRECKYFHIEGVEGALCLAHLAEGRVFPCFVKNHGDMIKCSDFGFREHSTAGGYKGITTPTVC
ncbi:hypothetical protein A2617_00045 [Candidatus Daviesbacteria bacterium RIFOXYD1_FULL_41_10]|uniref:Uncharacterized protein n=2 Tax=Candidatus Daviesiibacteriota TaxID=1752718 RepID=A0A1F5N1U9_9BACT|nr:MAG: hypothetical protein UU67_C0038G0005 [Candidatus Daviesbacteria bacterium GW2011_GWB1_41_5]OGE71607.1 MAG: hypothetical protein A2617_00045 [Candidatus Daviesbacteria bacterium RIFOXYD1_FULL_41_10]